MKKILLPLLGTALFIVAVGLFLKKAPDLNINPIIQEAEEKYGVEINNHYIDVTLARTDSERTKGLSEVSSLGSDSGMLFVFDDKEKAQVFWMKDMLIPIDIIWIKDGKIVRIDKDIPISEPQAPDDQLIKYSANVPVDYVLEVNAGYSNANSIKIGDIVTFSGI